jgi:serine-type D-Ala-D-Ala carboxypeptidase
MEHQLGPQLHLLLRNQLRHGRCQGVAGALAAGVIQFKKNKYFKVVAYEGSCRNDRIGDPIGPTSLFDLASLTKPLCTTLLLLKLLSVGRLRLEDRLGSLVDLGLPPDKQALRLDHLMSHCAGLPAYRCFYRLRSPWHCPGHRSWLFSHIAQEPLVRIPGQRDEYSDLGFLLLGAVVEAVSGQGIADTFAREVAGPLGLDSDLLFNPRSRGQQDRCVATEDCPWRQRVLVGEVHDEHCWLLGGASGHAGLFGTLEATLTLLKEFFAVWQGRDSLLELDRGLVRQALCRQGNNQTWAMGFDTPTPGACSGGDYLSGLSVGHLGFTGTSFWLDPVGDRIVVLLTNRVHPSRDNLRIRQFRPQFHDAVLGLLRSYLAH